MPLGHPLSRYTAHAADLTPCQQAHAVHLVRRLAVYDSSTLGDVQLVRTSGTQHPVGSAPGGHGAQPSERARHDDLPHGAHDRAGTTGTTAEELHPVPLCGLDHPFRLSKADGHGLFDNDVLAALGS